MDFAPVFFHYALLPGAVFAVCHLANVCSFGLRVFFDSNAGARSICEYMLKESNSALNSTYLPLFGCQRCRHHRRTTPNTNGRTQWIFNFVQRSERGHYCDDSIYIQFNIFEFMFHLGIVHTIFGFATIVHIAASVACIGLTKTWIDMMNMVQIGFMGCKWIYYYYCSYSKHFGNATVHKLYSIIFLLWCCATSPVITLSVRNMQY